MTDAIDLAQAAVLITGGSDGIGQGLAQRFMKQGARVLVTGRDPERLRRSADRNPGLLTFVNDMSQPAERERLAQHVRDTMPGLNIVVNNAGFQRRVPLATDDAPWPERQGELDTLLAGPVHLNHLLVPTILARGRPSVIVNVTSGGAFIPQPFAPMYSACKAALHSYTVNLRFALAGTPCRVVELIPPAVQTGLAGPGASHGAPLDEFCDSVFAALTTTDADEIGFGMTNAPQLTNPRSQLDEVFRGFAGRFPVKTYANPN